MLIINHSLSEINFLATILLRKCLWAPRNQASASKGLTWSGSQQVPQPDSAIFPWDEVTFFHSTLDPGLAFLVPYIFLCPPLQTSPEILHSMEVDRMASFSLSSSFSPFSSALPTHKIPLPSLYEATSRVYMVSVSVPIIHLYFSDWLFIG